MPSAEQLMKSMRELISNIKDQITQLNGLRNQLNALYSSNTANSQYKPLFLPAVSSKNLTRLLKL